MKKLLLSLVLVFALVFSFAACTNVHESPSGDFTDDKVLFWLTKQATDETIFHDYTIEDFPEVAAVSIEEIDGRTSDTDGLTHSVRQCLLEDPAGAAIPDHLKNYKRMFAITLAEKGKQNVLSAVDILKQREDIEDAFPNYIDGLD